MLLEQLLIEDTPISVDGFQWKIEETQQRIAWAKSLEAYYYQQPISKLDGAWVEVGGKRKLMFATYSYLGLLQHPAIEEAAKRAIDFYGVGTHGVRLLGGTLDLHLELEQTIAHFHEREAAIVYSSGYVTNLATISTLVGKGDWVLSDKWNHASIVDGCVLARGEFVRFRHNDMDDLEHRLQQAPPGAGKLVVADAVFSMDGDIFHLPEAVELCNRYNARLMVDEAHSLGVLGATGHGIEEYFGMPGAIDIKMGTLSKTIPGIGGYIAGDRDMIDFLKHTARGFVFLGSLAAISDRRVPRSLSHHRARGRRAQPHPLPQRRSFLGWAQGHGLRHRRQRHPHRSHYDLG